MSKVEVFLIYVLSSICFSMLLFLLFIWFLHYGRENLFFEIYLIRLVAILVFSAAINHALKKMKWYNFGRCNVCAAVTELGVLDTLKLSIVSLDELQLVSDLFSKESIEPDVEKTEDEGEGIEDLENFNTSAEKASSKGMMINLFPENMRFKENCIWAYYFKNRDTKQFKQAVEEAFTLLHIQELQYEQKLTTVRTLYYLTNTVVFILFVLWAIVNVRFSVMNLVFLFVIWKFLINIFSEGVSMPIYLNMILNEFSIEEWKSEYDTVLKQLSETNQVLKSL